MSARRLGARRPVLLSMVLVAVGLSILYLQTRPPSPKRYENVVCLAQALFKAGKGCTDLNQTLRGVPTAEGWDQGECTAAGAGVALHVSSNPKALRGLKKEPGGPVVYWVVGENWLIATESRAAAEEIRAATGGTLA